MKSVPPMMIHDNFWQLLFVTRHLQKVGWPDMSWNIRITYKISVWPSSGQLKTHLWSVGQIRYILHIFCQNNRRRLTGVSCFHHQIPLPQPCWQKLQTWVEGWQAVRSLSLGSVLLQNMWTNNAHKHIMYTHNSVFSYSICASNWVFFQAHVLLVDLWGTM